MLGCRSEPAKYSWPYCVFFIPWPRLVSEETERLRWRGLPILLPWDNAELLKQTEIVELTPKLDNLTVPVQHDIHAGDAYHFAGGRMPHEHATMRAAVRDKGRHAIC